MLCPRHRLCSSPSIHRRSTWMVLRRRFVGIADPAFTIGGGQADQVPTEREDELPPESVTGSAV